MIIIKFILLFFIFILSIYIGILISKKYLNRLDTLKQMKVALNILEAKIKFNFEPIPNIFLYISKNVNNKTSQIFKKSLNNMSTMSAGEAWKNALETEKEYLSKDDLDVLKTLGNLLRKNRYRRTSKSNRNNKIFYRYANCKS